MEPPDFDEYVDVLRQRLFDYEALPDFADLMSDYAGVVPTAWPVQAYEELQVLGHLNPQVSGLTMGPRAHGRLSADGRYYVRQQRHNA